ncbi:MAG: dephospho-CoA kinase [Clostridia bacterium]|nr:dephospho-CoA kinase [Clostridia bacterium]
MLIIGLAGGSGSGKGIVSSLFSVNGIPAFDCDAVYHDLISRNGCLTRELADAFGKKILARDGGIDRRALFSAAFADGESRRRLNEISHRRILAVLREWIERAKAQGISAVIVDAPLLFESGFDRECDVTVAVTAQTELRIQRIVSRDGISREEAERRISAQIPDDELSRRADYTLQNDGDVAELVKEVNQILKTINERRNKQ